MHIDTILVEFEPLKTREETHGNFSENSGTSQSLKSVMRGGSKWKTLSTSQQESLEMIAHKIGRILSGNPNFKGHWDDIAGYATLISKELLNPTSQALENGVVDS